MFFEDIQPIVKSVRHQIVYDSKSEMEKINIFVNMGKPDCRLGAYTYLVDLEVDSGFSPLYQYREYELYNSDIPTTLKFESVPGNRQYNITVGSMPAGYRMLMNVNVGYSGRTGIIGRKAISRCESILTNSSANSQPLFGPEI